MRTVPYFRSKEEIEEVLGGYFRRLPSMDPLLRAALDDDDSLLKIELENPECNATLDFGARPFEVTLGSDAFGTIGMSAEADVFHEMMLGRLDTATALSHRKLVVRGPVARLMRNVALTALSPYQYPLYLRSIGREDLIPDGERPVLEKPLKPVGLIAGFYLKIMYAVGYVVGLLNRGESPRMDVFKALERTGPMLVGITRFFQRTAAPGLTVVMVLISMGRGMSRAGGT